MIDGLEADSTLGRGVITLAFVAVLMLAVWVIGRGVCRSIDDPQQQYGARRLIRTVGWAVGFVGFAIIWRPLGGNLAPALGLATAGLAFAMQEVIGAIAGWFNITFGKIFRVGDRIEMDGVQGDVIDISLLKTRLMETGSESTAAWVQGRQFTGRVVAISNKASFTAPVFNFSSYFDFIWEEVQIAVPHHGDWHAAAAVLEDEARRQSGTQGARAAMNEVRRRFPVPEAEVEPRVFISADTDYMRLSARFVVPIRSERSVKDEITRRTHERLEAEGIEIVGTQVVQQAETPWRPIDDDADDADEDAAPSPPSAPPPTDGPG